jgi:ATP-dependent DNA helicase RecG
MAANKEITVLTETVRVEQRQKEDYLSLTHMGSLELKIVLERLITTWENEVVEFKQATDAYGTDDIGKYFSALANEANLRGTERGWLVFGVNNKTRSIVGTDYRVQADRLQSLKQQVASDTEPRITFRNIHELQHADGRVLLFEIPAAPLGIPIAWKGHYYARAGESLSPLGLSPGSTPTASS